MVMKAGWKGRTEGWNGLPLFSTNERSPPSRPNGSWQLVQLRHPAWYDCPARGRVIAGAVPSGLLQLSHESFRASYGSPARSSSSSAGESASEVSIERYRFGGGAHCSSTWYGQSLQDTNGRKGTHVSVPDRLVRLDVLPALEHVATAGAQEAAAVADLTRLGDLDKLAVPELEATAAAGVLVDDWRALGRLERPKDGPGSRCRERRALGGRTGRSVAREGGASGRGRWRGRECAAGRRDGRGLVGRLGVARRREDGGR